MSLLSPLWGIQARRKIDLLFRGEKAGINYYVDATNGNDANNGRSADLAWQTIAKVNGSSFDPGDRILFKRGETWTGTRLVVPSSGISGNPVVFGAYGTGALPVLQGTSTGCFRIADKEYVVVRDFDLSAINTVGDVGALQVHDSSNVSLLSLTARNSTGSGIFTEEVDVPGSTHDVLVRGCTVYDNGTSGIAAQDLNANGVENIYVLNCIAYDNGTDTDADHGIYLRECRSSLVKGNLSYANASAGIKLNTCQNTIVERNVCHSHATGAGLQDDAQRAFTGGNTFQNNLCYGNQTGADVLTNISGDYWYHNTLVNNTGRGFYAVGTNNTGHIIKSNIILQDGNVINPFGAYCIRLVQVGWLNNNTFDNNCVIYIDTGNGDTCYAEDDASYTWAEWQALGAAPDPNSINQNPSFVTDYTDLHLQSNSPCRGEGATGTGVTDDYDGVTRGSPPDIGAYEYVT